MTTQTTPVLTLTAGQYCDYSVAALRTLALNGATPVCPADTPERSYTARYYGVGNWPAGVTALQLKDGGRLHNGLVYRFHTDRSREYYGGVEGIRGIPLRAETLDWTFIWCCEYEDGDGVKFQQDFQSFPLRIVVAGDYVADAHDLELHHTHADLDDVAPLAKVLNSHHHLHANSDLTTIIVGLRAELAAVRARLDALEAADAE